MFIFAFCDFKRFQTSKLSIYFIIPKLFLLNFLGFEIVFYYNLL